MTDNQTIIGDKILVYDSEGNIVESDYSIEVDKGISSCTFNGKELKDDTRYGDGENIIEIDGGIGDIEITTK